MKLCGEQQSFVTVLVQYHKAVLSFIYVHRKEKVQ